MKCQNCEDLQKKTVKNAQPPTCIRAIFGPFSSVFLVFLCIYIIPCIFVSRPTLLWCWCCRHATDDDKRDDLAWSRNLMVRPIDEAGGWRDEESIDTEIPYRTIIFGCMMRALPEKYFQKFIIWNFMMRDKISGHQVILCGIRRWHNWWLLVFLTISGLVQIYLATSDLIKPYPYYQKYSKTPSLSVEEHKKQRDDTLDQSVSFFFWYLYPLAFFCTVVNTFSISFWKQTLAQASSLTGGVLLKWIFNRRTMFFY